MSKENHDDSQQTIKVIKEGLIKNSLNNFAKVNEDFDKFIKDANTMLTDAQSKVTSSILRTDYTPDNDGRKAYSAAITQAYGKDPVVQQSVKELQTLQNQFVDEFKKTFDQLEKSNIEPSEIATAIMEDKKLYKLFVEDRGINELILEHQNDLMSNIFYNAMNNELNNPKIVDKADKTLGLLHSQITKITELQKNYDELSEGETKENQDKMKAPIEAHTKATKKFCDHIKDQKDIEKFTDTLSESLKTVKPEFTDMMIKSIKEVTKDNPKLCNISTALKAECYMRHTVDEVKATKENNKTIDSQSIKRISEGLTDIVKEVLKTPKQQEEFKQVSKDLIRDYAAKEGQLSWGSKILHHIDKIFSKSPEQKMEKLLANNPELKEIMKNSITSDTPAPKHTTTQKAQASQGR